MVHVATINQDPGIDPRRNKGAAIHLVAMREAFTQRQARVTAFDLPVHDEMLRALERGHASAPFDLVYERHALGRRAGAEFARRHGIPLALEVNAPLAEEAARHRGTAASPQDRENDHFVFGQADLVVAVSGLVADYAIERGARQGAVIVCPNGIDTARFHERVDASRVRSDFALGDSFVVGFHGRERPWHGFAHLVQAVRGLIEDGLHVHLLVVGEGEFAALDGLPAQRYSRVGWQPHQRMPEFVAAFDALPLTYGTDAPCYFSPLKLAEAMACGTVPVVPDIGDLAEQVTHRQTGLVYAAGDWRALSRSIAELVADRALCDRLGRGAARQASGRAWSRIVDEVLGRTGLAAINKVAEG